MTGTNRNIRLDFFIEKLNLRFFFDHTEEALLGLITLRYVPNYFDILPMYLVIMLWIPVVWALSEIRVGLALGFPVAVYLAMGGFGLELPADLRSDRPWFFNPFGWQLVFFTGFAFGQGWLKPPPPKPWLVAACVVFLLAALPLSPEPALRPTAWLVQLHADLQPWLDKTRFGLLRWLHFLALAYVVTVFLKNREHWLTTRAARPIVDMGRQSLPVFILTMALSYLGGMAFDRFGHSLATILLINLGGCAFLLAAARSIGWLKSSPWKIPSDRSTSSIPEEDRCGQLFGFGPNWLKQASIPGLLGALVLVPMALSYKQAETPPIGRGGEWG